jgi:hypothetical protein
MESLKLWASENKRNTDNSELFLAILREAYDRIDVAVAAHHIIYTRDGVTDEIPSADYLIFDNDIAQKIWKSNYKEVLTRLALEPVPTRDALLLKLYRER